MKILYIGGTGEISYSCLKASAAMGHCCTVYNRGRSGETLPEGTRQIAGELGDKSTYAKLAGENFDVVCQFLAYSPNDVERDIATFGGRCGQYVFISTASAYLKPPTTYRITEDVPLINPFWGYSSTKAAMEQTLLKAHEQKKMPVTIVRPSHTYRKGFASTFIGGMDHAWRLLNGRPIISHGDGTSLWTLTHSDDFAPPFAKLLGNPKSLGEAYHIMTDTAFTWDEIFAATAKALGVEAKIVHVPSETLVRYKKEWTGPLLGDKSWSTLFDTSKVQKLVGPMPQPTPLNVGLKRVAERNMPALESFVPKPELHALLDRICEEQTKLGS